MKTYRVFLGLGSNVGDRQDFLNRAIKEVAAIPSTKVVWASSVYETTPYGDVPQSDFLNAAGEIETGLLPSALLGELKVIEQKVGRVRRERWGPREIDLDILLYDGFVTSEGDAIVPHPELGKRKFALVPLREIAPDVVHPVNGMTVTELAQACTDAGRVVKTQFRIRW